jgi:Arc-like DNA binding domain
MKAVDEVTRELRRRLAAKEWQPGDRFLTFDQLMGQYKALTNIYRVKLALRPLNDDGLVETMHGSATWVRRLPATPAEAGETGTGQQLTGIPAGLYEQVKDSARRHHRSVDAEIVSLLERGLKSGPAQPAAILSPHQSRPGRRVVVLADLGDLRGPAGGKVILPKNLYWSPPGRVWDVDDYDLRQEMYKVVLNEAFRPADLAGWLNGPLLVEMWPDLHLPRGVRQAWEEQHDILHAAGTAGKAA